MDEEDHLILTADDTEVYFVLLSGVTVGLTQVC